MALDSKKYREYLHQTRSHPETLSPEAISSSVKYFHWSVPCCLALEWFLEAQMDGLPPGLGFPVGFLLFWAFYYTFYRSGLIESKLGSSIRPNEKKVAQPTSPPVASPQGLPKEIENALSLLGLKGCRDWGIIHKRYRELAKKFHPDLNPEITTAGNRFIIYDGAYRRLSAVKEKYFKASFKN